MSTEQPTSIRKIPIHAWGGLGSQLYALALHIDLRNLLGLETYIVSHSSGVTKRDAELAQYCQNIEIRQIDDYSRKTNNSSDKASSSVGIFSIVKQLGQLAKITGLISEANTDGDFRNIRKYTQSFRGHYSLRLISVNTLHRMNELLRDKPFDSKSIVDSTTMEIGLHYRLGDLTHLVNKAYIEPSRIQKVLTSSKEAVNCEYLCVASDSSDLAIEKISPFIGSEFDTKIISGDSLNVLSELIHKRIFVGTNSKISIWIAIIRIYFSRHKESWMPQEVRHHLEANIGDSLLLNSVRFY